MRNYSDELDKRVEYIKETLKQANSNGIVFNNSGGKDCALTAILCKKACDNVIGLSLPCGSKRNYEDDVKDAEKLAEKFNIENIVADLLPAKQALLTELEKVCEISDLSDSNIAPRLRMTAAYAVAQTKGYLVAGTGNKSEIYMGYFTKWGDGAYDFNPIADLTATEVKEFLKFLDAPINIIEKAPSAGLFDGQTDEEDLGMTYKEIDGYITEGIGSKEVQERLKKINKTTKHKRTMPSVYKKND